MLSLKNEEVKAFNIPHKMDFWVFHMCNKFGLCEKTFTLNIQRLFFTIDN